MKVAIIVVFVIAIIAGGYILKSQGLLTPSQQSATTTAPTQNNQTSSSTNQPDMKIMASGLDTPWALGFLPNGDILVTERAGQVRLITKDGQLQREPVAILTSVKEIGEGGLLGIAIHPQFSTNNYVYLYYTYNQSGNNTKNRVVRMTFSNNKLTSEKIILDNIPGASNHDGGRIKFGPDTMLYIGTGDAQEPSQAQDTKSLAGKILRVTDEGKPAPNNPFNNEVFSYGHRNVQGIAWNSDGDLWATEHGRSGVASGLDELNFIEGSKNYGWPEIEGNETRSGMVTPRRNSGGSTTWAPAGAAFVNNSLFFAGLRGQTLYEAVISNGQVEEVKEHFTGEYGRIREAIVGPDNMLYISTSNHDGRGTPSSDDDRIIRIKPASLN